MHLSNENSIYYSYRGMCAKLPLRRRHQLGHSRLLPLGSGVQHGATKALGHAACLGYGSMQFLAGCLNLTLLATNRDSDDCMTKLIKV